VIDTKLFDRFCHNTIVMATLTIISANRKHLCLPVDIQG
jgi:hypothetical protein